MSKFHKPQLPKSSGNPIAASKDAVRSSNQSLVKFSLKYLDNDHPSFNFSIQGSDYFLKLLDRLKNISTMSVSNLRSNYNKSLRNHPIKWEDTTEQKFGLPNEEQLVDQPFQFSVSSNEHGRVMGFFIDNTFYIVWLDTNHSLYS